MAALTTPRHTVRGTVHKELLDRERYTPGYERLKRDHLTGILHRIAKIIKHQDKLIVELCLGTTASMYMKNHGKPLLQLPIGSEALCTCCRSTIDLNPQMDIRTSVIFATGPPVACQHQQATDTRREPCMETASQVGLMVNGRVIWLCTPHFRKFVEHQVCAECGVGAVYHWQHNVSQCPVGHVFHYACTNGHCPHLDCIEQPPMGLPLADAQHRNENGTAGHFTVEEWDNYPHVQPPTMVTRLTTHIYYNSGLHQRPNPQAQRETSAVQRA